MESPVEYLQKQIRSMESRLRRYTHDKKGQAYFRRFMLPKIAGYIERFLGNEHPQTMLIMPGFRGVGKTTLMAQIAADYLDQAPHMLFLSVEDAHNLMGIGVAELVEAYEDILGEDLSRIEQPVLLFLDEVQADPKWSVTLKSLFDRTNNVFFFCTGSSSLALQTTSNLARRAAFVTLTPMCFTEYTMTAHQVAPPDIGKQMDAALYDADDAAHVYKQLNALRPDVLQYWSQLHKSTIRKYLAYGSLPFSALMPHETAIYDSISLLLDKIIMSDLPLLGDFDIKTLSMVKRILFTIAEHDTTSLTKLAEQLGMSRVTLTSLFDALEKSELLMKVPAYGSNMSVAKKANKYLFAAPALRMAFFYITGQTSTYDTRQGKLLEDAVGTDLRRRFVLNGLGALRYDSAKGGADFIVQIANQKQIIIEVGVGKKDLSQIKQTAKKVDADYHLVLSNTELKLDKATNTVFVPLEYYLTVTAK